MDPQKAVIVGAGLAGSLLATLLGQRGWVVDVYEKRSDPRLSAANGGRSINLALSTRGIHALGLAGVADNVLKLTIPMAGRMIHDLDGETHLQPYGKDDTEVIRSVSRGGLNNLLLDSAEATGNVSCHFDTGCESIDFDSRIARFSGPHGITETSTSYLFGCDGAGSVVRQSLEKARNIQSTSDILPHGYKELTIPAGPDGSHLLDNNALHIWPRKSYMLIALPNLDGTFTLTLFMPNEGDISFARYADARSAKKFFEADFADALSLMPDFEMDYDHNPVGMLGTVRCQPWSDDGYALLLGDAAHAIVPFFGQGMNCSFEDCARLISMIDEGATGQWPELSTRYETERKPDTDAIATMALQNYVEMRDSVSDPQYVLKRKIALELELRYPSKFIPRYSMVTFNRLRYSVALERGKRQADILNTLIQSISTIEDVDWKMAGDLVNQLPALTINDGLVS
ncbi:MAG: FAD-dependent monooxygenase [Rhodothermales bacterium]|nr:FAD-dependent monooxygenase [Rhodothermales bacterium]